MIEKFFVKARARFKRDGFLRVMTRVGYHARNYPAASMELRRRRRFQQLDQLFDYANTAATGYFTPLQVRSEMVRLLELVRQLRPARVMEIGTALGGTLLMWTRVAATDARLISLDLPDGPWGGGYGSWKAPLYRQFALPGQRIDLIRADSHLPQSRRKVEALLNGQQLDFLMIDGDHSYAGVRQDFEMYEPLVRKHGLIALHDVTEHVPEAQCEVSRFWLELKVRYPEHDEIIENPAQRWAGIGVIRKP